MEYLVPTCRVKHTEPLPLWVFRFLAKKKCTLTTKRNPCQPDVLNSSPAFQESVARGCALQAAILSPLYKVRDFEVKDVSPFGISISWLGFGGDAPLDGNENTEVENGEKKAGAKWTKRGILEKEEGLLMAEIRHQLIGSLTHNLQGFIHPRWCRISSITRLN